MSDFEPMPQEPEESPLPETGLTPAPDQEYIHEPDELFQYWSQPEIVLPTRIPHLGHFFLLMAFALFGAACTASLLMAATHLHLFGLQPMKETAANVHYILGEEAAIYLITLALSLVIFPLLWKKSFFVGIQWNGQAALQFHWRLPAVALGCFLLAGLDETLLPGPSNAPIEGIFRSPGAAWLMFGFAITLAPFFEEIAFRGFLLPALATCCDWTVEHFTGRLPRPLDDNGHPVWSVPAMVLAALATSLPFALIHAEQTGHALGPFLLLISVSLVLCAVRFVSRSLAACVVVHACYNFLLFFLMLIGTGGFRHMGNM
jgi:uncharacterized protein